MTTLDYGARRPVRRRAITLGAIALLVIAALAVLAFIIQDRATRMAEARAWTVSGPPCPQGRPAALVADGESVSQVMDFDGVRFARVHGAVRCAEIGYDEGRSGSLFPVCEFDHPGAVSVATARGVTVFVPPSLQAATIQVRHDTPSCVVGSNMEIR
jgi:hypothetical protein